MIREHYAKAASRCCPSCAATGRLRGQIAVVHRSRSSRPTLLPVAFGVFGLVYAVPGARARRDLRVERVPALARDDAHAVPVALFHYSLLYLALLFVAMALDAGRMTETLPETPPADTMHEAIEPDEALARKNLRFAWLLVCCS
jgi:heme O synthase-like polyprenyltransferase